MNGRKGGALLGLAAGALLCGSPALAAPKENLPPDPSSAAVRRLLDRLPPDLPAGSRRLVEGLLVFEAPLDAEAIESAEKIRRRVAHRRSPMDRRCATSAMPLDMRFADYTIGPDGQVIPGSTGWTRAERARLSRFLCRMLPILQEQYGDPFQRWSVTLVKDLRYASSWIVIPSVLEIHTAGEWNPRLLAHEVHPA